MRLSAEMFNMIVAGLRSDSRNGKDKRLEPRVGLAGEAPLFSVNETGKRITGLAKVRDLSRRGIGIIFNQVLVPKQRFVIQLTHEDEKPLWLVCITAHCRAIDGDRFMIGAKIEQLLNAKEIRKMEHDKAAAAALSTVEAGRK